MKTLKDLKARLKPGVYITTVRHDWYPSARNLNVPALVVESNSVGFAVLRPGTSSPSYCDWPKAKELTFTENGFEVGLDETKPHVRMGYRFLSEQELPKP